MKYYLVSILTLILLITSCKKDEKDVVLEEQYIPFIAPCEINPIGFDSMTVYYNGSQNHPEALYRLLLIDTNMNGHDKIEIGFNKIPVSGIYQIVGNIDINSIDLPNQIAFHGDSGAFEWHSAYANNGNVYVENNETEITISYCSIGGDQFEFNTITLMYFGNKPGPFKINMKY